MTLCAIRCMRTAAFALRAALVADAFIREKSFRAELEALTIQLHIIQVTYSAVISLEATGNALCTGFALSMLFCEFGRKVIPVAYLIEAHALRTELPAVARSINHDSATLARLALVPPIAPAGRAVRGATDALVVVHVGSVRAYVDTATVVGQQWLWRRYAAADA